MPPYAVFHSDLSPEEVLKFKYPSQHIAKLILNDIFEMINTEPRKVYGQEETDGRRTFFTVEFETISDKKSITTTRSTITRETITVIGKAKEPRAPKPRTTITVSKTVTIHTDDW